MKKTKTIIFIFIGLAVVILGYLYFGLKTNSPSPELSLNMFSPLSELKSKVIAASCGFTIHGSADENVACTSTVNCCYGPSIMVTGTSQCGGACTGSSYYVGGTPTTSGNVTCQNHPNFGQPCTSQPNACGVTSTGTYNACGVCSATTPSIPTCTLTNACGQTFTGGMCNGVCTAAPDAGNINNSCISTFNVTTDSVNPNGSVEFSWSIVNTPGVGSRCGFVDLTTPTPRPIPGLQNLDPGTDRVRISNIQTTTRFCLVCQFYNLVNNNTLGDAAVHQWIRVIRIGEN